jgi:hypothetical protein
MTKAIGTPRGRPPGPTTRFRREIAACEGLMAGALQDSTEALIDLARGVRVLHVIDAAGQPQLLPPDKARLLASQPEVVDAGLRTGQLRVYALPPDLMAIRVLHERLMGKAPTQTELTILPAVERVQLDHALLAKVITDHVPDEYLAPVLTELRRLAGGGGAAGAGHA